MLITGFVFRTDRTKTSKMLRCYKYSYKVSVWSNTSSSCLSCCVSTQGQLKLQGSCRTDKKIVKFLLKYPRNAALQYTREGGREPE